MVSVAPATEDFVSSNRSESSDYGKWPLTGSPAPKALEGASARTGGSDPTRPDSSSLGYLTTPSLENIQLSRKDRQENILLPTADAAGAPPPLTVEDPLDIAPGLAVSTRSAEEGDFLLQDAPLSRKTELRHRAFSYPESPRARGREQQLTSGLTIYRVSSRSSDGLDSPPIRGAQIRSLSLPDEFDNGAFEDFRQERTDSIDIRRTDHDHYGVDRQVIRRIRSERVPSGGTFRDNQATSRRNNNNNSNRLLPTYSFRWSMRKLSASSASGSA